MRSLTIFLVLLSFVPLDGGLLPTVTQNDHKSRVLDLVRRDKFLVWFCEYLFLIQTLSQQEHFDDEKGEHNPQFDHEAFLGADQAKFFEKLSPEESKKRLG